MTRLASLAVREAILISELLREEEVGNRRGCNSVLGTPVFATRYPTWGFVQDRANADLTGPLLSSLWSFLCMRFICKVPIREMKIVYAEKRRGCRAKSERRPRKPRGSRLATTKNRLWSRPCRCGLVARPRGHPMTSPAKQHSGPKEQLSPVQHAAHTTYELRPSASRVSGDQLLTLYMRAQANRPPCHSLPRICGASTASPIESCLQYLHMLMQAVCKFTLCT